MLNAPEKLLSLGFTYIGTCNCNGSHNKKYKRGEWLVYVTKSSYKIKRNGSTIKGYSDIEGLEIYLQKALPQFFTGEQVPGSPGV